MSNTNPGSGPRSRAAIGALVFGCLVVTVLVALYAWQVDRRDSKIDEAEQHAEAVLSLQDASSNADISGELILAYVSQGDDDLIPQIQEHSDTAIVSITKALSLSSSDEIAAIAQQGTSLADGAGQVIALRQTGNVEAAAETLNELRESFDSFGIVLDNATNAELDTAASLQTDADNADQTASWLLITAMAVGVSTAAGLVYVVASALLKRRVPETPTPA